MRALDWAAHMALARALAGPALVAAPDPMALPLVALRPGSGVLATDDVPLIETLPGGAVRLRRLAAGTDDLPVIQISGSDAEAAARAAMRPADLVAGRDGRWQAATALGEEICARIVAQLADLDALGDEAALPLPAGPVGPLSRLDTERAALWFDPMVALRLPSRAVCLRQAAAGTVELDRWQPMAFCLPAIGLGPHVIRLRLEGDGPFPGIEVPTHPQAVVTEPEERQIDIALPGAEAGLIRIGIAGHRRRVARIAVLVPASTEPGEMSEMDSASVPMAGEAR